MTPHDERQPGEVSAHAPISEQGERERAHDDGSATRRDFDHEPTVSMMVLRGLVDAVEEMGVARSVFLAEAGLRAGDLERPEARLPSREVDRVAALAIAMTGDPAFGLHWAERLSHRTFGPVSHLLSYAGTLRQALVSLGQFERLFHDGTAYALHEVDEHAELRVVLSFEGRSLEMQRFAAEMITAGFQRPIRALCPRAQMLRVNYAYDAPAYQAEYPRIFGPVVHFAQPHTGIVFERALLDAPSPHRDEAMRAALHPLAEQRMMRSLGTEPCARKLYDLLREHAPRRLNMTVAARQLGFSERSLRRHLSAEGCSYLDVERQVLSDWAKRMMRDQRRTIQETAYELGFADATAFHRAFKRWTGTTPSAFVAEPTRRSDTEVDGVNDAHREER